MEDGSNLRSRARSAEATRSSAVSRKGQVEGLCRAGGADRRPRASTMGSTAVGPPGPWAGVPSSAVVIIQERLVVASQARTSAWAAAAARGPIAAAGPRRPVVPLSVPGHLEVPQAVRGLDPPTSLPLLTQICSQAARAGLDRYEHAVRRGGGVGGGPDRNLVGDERVRLGLSPFAA